MKTFVPKNPGENRRWVVVDAEGKSLGRLAVVIANALRGKDRPTFAPQIDTGDFVIVINAAKVRLTGRKEEQKKYMRYPDRIIRHAVHGMLPKNHMAIQMMRRLKVYAGAEHPHAAQQPVAL